MFITALKFIGGFVSKDLLMSMFKDVIVEFAVDILEEFTKSTENEYDDKLVAKFKEFLEEQD